MKTCRTLFVKYSYNIDVMKKAGAVFRGDRGFSLLEIMIALVIFSVALLALASVSFGVLNSNHLNKKYIEASLYGQDLIESWRSVSYVLGDDLTLGTSDDSIPEGLQNPSTSNDTVTDIAILFEAPDYAYADANGDGVEEGTLTASPTMTLSSEFIRRVWIIRDNKPVANMKTLTVVVGWLDGTTPNYVTISTVLQED